MHCADQRPTPATTCLLLALLLSGGASAAEFTVNTARDDSPPADGLCSLREALGNASANLENSGGDCPRGDAFPDVDRVLFDIPGEGPHNIRLREELPVLEEAVVIDGLSQPANGGKVAHCRKGPLLVALHGGDQVADGLVLEGPLASGSLIRGLVLRNFEGAAISINFSDENLVQCNFIGTTPSGRNAGPNAFGVVIRMSSDDNVVGTDGDGVGDADEQNVISGNSRSSGEGVRISGAFTEGNRVAGNLIGTDISGRKPIANRHGVRIRDGASRNVVGTNGDGLGDEAEGNLISGNLRAAGYGVHISDDGTEGNVVAGNKIGTNVFGNQPVPNKIGVRVRDGAVDTRIGTNGDGVSDALEGNLISGNLNGLGYGVRVSDTATTGTWIAGNLIGPNAKGTRSIGNKVGVRIQGVPGVIVGTNGDGIGDALEGNTISGHVAGSAYGVYVSGRLSRGTWIAGNKIGTDPDGLLPIENRIGVRLRDNARGVLVGTNADGENDDAERNLISGNTSDLGYGVYITDAGTEENKVAGNWIGLDATGLVKLPNNTGVRIADAATDNVVGTDGDGRGDRLEGNVISGNTSNFGHGVQLSGVGTERNKVAGNWIGPNVLGGLVGDEETGYGNRVGVRIRDGAARNVVGTDGDGRSDEREGNVISGHVGNVEITGSRSRGIRLSDEGVEENRIAGNWIGLRPNGSGTLRNDLGIEIEGGAHETVIGTNGDGEGDDMEGNVISGHSRWCGVCLYAELETEDPDEVPPRVVGTVIAGNQFGRNRRAIEIGLGVDETRIGSDGDGTSDAEEGNDIADNAVGVELGPDVLTLRGNVLRRNTVGVAVFGGSFADGSQGNCLSGNVTAVDNVSGEEVVFIRNWWGAGNGPGGAADGLGDAVSAGVVFVPYLTAAPAACEKITSGE